MIHSLNEKYWSDRYIENQTKWDTGKITPPLKEYFDQLDNKNLEILIPGCGNAHEAAYLHEQGFTNVYLVDISKIPLQNFMNNNPTFPAEHVLHKDFFRLEGQYDLIVEQTFFCALLPSLRMKYAEQVSNLLKKEGKLVGVLFDDPLNTDHPPFGGNPEEYEQYFKHFFEFEKYERCYNSIKPRKGREWFVLMRNEI